jgi:hypothetical protein
VWAQWYVEVSAGKGEAEQKGVIKPRPANASDINPSLPTTALDPIIIPIIPSLTLLEQELSPQFTFFPTSYRPNTDESTRNPTIDKINDGLP